PAKFRPPSKPFSGARSFPQIPARTKAAFEQQSSTAFVTLALNAAILCCLSEPQKAHSFSAQTPSALAGKSAALTSTAIVSTPWPTTLAQVDAASGHPRKTIGVHFSVSATTSAKAGPIRKNLRSVFPPTRAFL